MVWKSINSILKLFFFTVSILVCFRKVNKVSELNASNELIKGSWIMIHTALILISLLFLCSVSLLYFTSLFSQAFLQKKNKNLLIKRKSKFSLLDTVISAILQQKLVNVPGVLVLLPSFHSDSYFKRHCVNCYCLYNSNSTTKSNTACSLKVFHCEIALTLPLIHFFWETGIFSVSSSH